MKKIQGIITTTEAARILGISRSHVQRLTILGKLNGEKIHGQWVFDRDELDRYKSQKSDLLTINDVADLLECKRNHVCWLLKNNRIKHEKIDGVIVIRRDEAIQYREKNVAYLSIAEVAEAFGCTKPNVYYLIKHGRIAHEKINGLMVIHRDEVDRYREHGPLPTEKDRLPSNRLTVPQAAEFLNCTPVNVYHLINNGRIPAKVYGNITTVLRNDLEGYANKSEEKPENTVAEVAERLYLSYASVMRLLQNGRLWGVRVGRLWSIDEESIKFYLEEQNKPKEVVKRRRKPPTNDGSVDKFMRIMEALDLLAKGVPVQTVATRMNVDRRTVYRYMDEVSKIFIIPIYDGNNKLSAHGMALVTLWNQLLSIINTTKSLPDGELLSKMDIIQWFGTTAEKSLRGEV